MDDKDRRIAELEQKVAHLTAALRNIDFDVARAAKRYLRCSPSGVIDFVEFLDLLVLEVREVMRERRENQDATKEALREIVRERLGQEMAKCLPALKGRLSDYLTLEVVILPKTHQMQGHLLVKTEPFFKALSVRGDKITPSIGRTPEEAWTEMRKRLACHIFGAGPEMVPSLMAPRDWELAQRFQAGRPFLMDEIEGFKIEVRLVERAAKAEKAEKA